LLVHTVVRERAGGVRPDNRPVAVRGERVMRVRQLRLETFLSGTPRWPEPGGVGQRVRGCRIRALRGLRSTTRPPPAWSATASPSPWCRVWPGQPTPARGPVVAARLRVKHRG